jgi:hypothetical protein
MAVIQTSLEIPDAVLRRLLSGEYVRYGGVVRNRAGQLVELLDDASPSVGTAKALRARAIKSLSNPRSIVGLGVVVGAVAGGAAHLAKRAPRSAQLRRASTVENCTTSLSAYLEAARHGTLDEDVIAQLVADLDAVTAATERESIVLEFAPGQLEALVGVVAEHTRQLIEANHFQPTEMPKPSSTQLATIIDLRPYLEVQRELFGQAS